MSQMYTQPTSPTWIFRNPRTFIYFVRELTGVVIAAFCIYFAWEWSGDPAYKFVGGSFFYWASMVAFAASLIHSVTWLWVTTQVTPMTLPRRVQYALFAGLIVALVGASMLLNILFYS